MRRYRRGSHTVYELHFHFVFTTKYRKPVLRGDVGTRLRDLIREICKTKCGFRKLWPVPFRKFWPVPITA